MIAQDAGLSAALRQTLEDSGEYHLSVVPTGVQALEIASARQFDLAIVDMNLRGEYARKVIRDLRADQPRLAVVVIPMNNDPSSLALKGLDLQGVLTRPFTSANLVERIEKALGRPAPPAPPTPSPLRFPAEIAGVREGHGPLRYEDYSASGASVRPGQASAAYPLEGRQPPALVHSPPGPEMPQAPQSVLPEQLVPPWLEDVSKAAQYLARLSLETSAYAALLIRGPKLRVYAGQFSEAQAGELARLAHENWSRHGGRGALVRFVRLSPAEDDYILYSTSVAGDMVLSMVFHAEAPISMIRKQARQLVEALTRAPGSHPASPEERLRSEMLRSEMLRFEMLRSEMLRSEMLRSAQHDRGGAVPHPASPEGLAE